MFARIPAGLVFSQILLCGVFLCEPVLAQEPSPVLASLATPPARARDSRWLPPGVDENIPPVEPESACNLDEVLQKAGRRIQEFVKNVERFTATESLVHETINKSGAVSGTEKRRYNYMVTMEETRPKIFVVKNIGAAQALRMLREG